MTLGEKIKEARKKSGLSQEQLAEKLCLSRQAITKWESDRGLPDVENLKALSVLLDVSIDYLLDDGKMEEMNLLKEAIDWEQFSQPVKGKTKEDQVVLAKYADADAIIQLRRQKRRSSTAKIIDTALFLASSFLPYDTSSVYDGIQDRTLSYLVELGEKQVLVQVTGDFLYSYRLPKPVHGKKLELGDYVYSKTLRKIK